MYLKSLIAGIAFAAISAVSASAVTVTSAGGSYDIGSDILFTGSAVDTDGGAGSHLVNFYSLVDPVDGQVNASVTVGILGTFTDLTISWLKAGTAIVLDSVVVAPGINELRTTFTAPDLSQDLVFTWTDSTADVSFDFDVAIVPLPAGGLLLLTALGGLGIARRRKKA